MRYFFLLSAWSYKEAAALLEGLKFRYTTLFSDQNFRCFSDRARSPMDMYYGADGFTAEFPFGTKVVPEMLKKVHEVVAAAPAPVGNVAPDPDDLIDDIFGTALVFDDAPVKESKTEEDPLVEGLKAVLKELGDTIVDLIEPPAKRLNPFAPPVWQGATLGELIIAFRVVFYRLKSASGKDVDFSAGDELLARAENVEPLVWKQN